MRTLFSFVLVSAMFLSGCYLSHERMPEASVLCPEEPLTSVQAAAFSRVRADNLQLPAGACGVEVMQFTLQELLGADLQTAEYPYMFEPLTGSLVTSDGSAVFERVRLVPNDRPALFGPDAVFPTHGNVAEGMLWDASLLRAHHEIIFSLVVDIADGAEGTFEITLGEDCHLTPRMWFVSEDGETTEMPTELIGGNRPISVLVTFESG